MSKNITVFFKTYSRDFNGVELINFDEKLNVWMLNNNTTGNSVLIQREDVTHFIVTEGQQIEDGSREVGDGGGEEL